MSSTDSSQVQLVRGVIEGIGKRDVDHIAQLLHKDHRRITYPRSLGKPEQTKEEWFKNTSELISLWTESDVSYADCHSLELLQSKLICYRSQSYIPS
jgi:hypothetical protein